MRRILTRLGEDATLVRGTGTPTTVRGLYIAPYAVIDIGPGGVNGSNPQFAFMSSDFAVAKGDILTRSGVTFTVVVKQPDDPSGITLAELKRAS